MELVGDKFGRLEIFVPELIQAAETVNILNEKVIQPRLQATGNSNRVNNKSKVLIASVKGDLHDIGKNMVSLML
jgi:5-methyltetrahydrofolate--homocysteine methyltransferase|tara:strand:+ start:790 stop:1011 length:222 start_codon:yes stop_codon:yes gene_type:complete